MKKRTTLLIGFGTPVLLLLILVISSFTNKNEYEAIGLPLQFHGKYIYARAIPVDAYAEVDDKGFPTKYAEDLNSGGMRKIMRIIDEAFWDEQKANKKGKTDKNFDAVIFENSSKGTLITLKNKSSQPESKVQKLDGKDIYVYSWPGRRFNYVEFLDVSTTGIGQANNTGDELARIINGVNDKGLRKVKKGDLKDYDGIVFGADMMFQNASTVEGGGLTARTGGHLIKYCDDGKCDSDSIYQAYIDRMFPKPYSGDAHCVAVIMEKRSMGMSASVSYAAYFIEVGNSKGAAKDKVIEQARQYVRNNYGSSNGYKESQVLVEYNDCKNFKKTIMSQVKLSDFRVDYIKFKE